MVNKFLKNSWLGSAHLMFPAQRFAFQRASRFETTSETIISHFCLFVKDYF
jgi:hypothetical protein